MCGICKSILKSFHSQIVCTGKRIKMLLLIMLSILKFNIYRSRNKALLFLPEIMNMCLALI